MLYIGLDVHLKHITVCVLNDSGKQQQRCQVSDLPQLMKFLTKLTEPFEVCFEASCGYGQLFERLQTVARKVLVAHPGLLRLIYRSKQKNDRRDAQNLAKLLFLDEVPTVHVPTSDVRAWRELITFRRKLIEKRTRAKNGLRALLRTLAIKAPRQPGLWTKQGMLWLQQLELTQSMYALKRDLLIEEVEALTLRIGRVEQELAVYARDNVAVWQLQSIPGVGLRTAEAIVAYLDDPHRFPNSKCVGAYFGLVPSQDQSGNTNRLGHITRQGSASVRQLLTEAVWQAQRRSPTIKAYLERIQRGDKQRRKIALIATAHYLVRVMWSMLKQGTLWRETLVA